MPLKIVRRHGSPFWYLRGTVRGVRVDESAGTDDRRAAEEIRARREAAILDESIHGRRAVSTFAHAALSYIEAGGERRFLAPLLKHFGTRKLATIGQSDIDAAAVTLYPHAKPGTRNRQVYTPVSAVLRHAAARGMCEARPVERLTQPRGRLRWLAPDEASRLVSACGPHLRPLVMLMLYTGARTSEAIYLDWREVDLQRAHVAFLDTKNGTSRGVPLHPIVVAALGNLPHRMGAVFRRPDGRPYMPRDYGGGQMKTAFRRAVRNAGLGPDVTPHALRHTWATWHYAAHRDLLGLASLGGWRTLSMVQRYAHVNAEHLAPQIGALPVIEVGEIAGSCAQTAPKRFMFHVK